MPFNPILPPCEKKFYHCFCWFILQSSETKEKIYLYSHNTQNKLFLSNKSHRPNVKSIRPRAWKEEDYFFNSKHFKKLNLKLLNKKMKTEFLPRKFHWRHISSTSVLVFYLLFSFFCFQFWITAENIIIYSLQYETAITKPINYNGIYFLQIMLCKFKQSPDTLNKKN